MQTARILATACAAMLVGRTAGAAAVTPDSYDMLNGNTGSFQY